MLNRIGATPFVMAAKSGDVPLMRVLLELGADAEPHDERGHDGADGGGRRRHLGARRESRHARRGLAAVKLALEAGGGDVNAIDKNGETALHGAVYRGGDIPVIQFLVDRGAALDVVNAKGWTPLTVADGVEYTPDVLKRYPEAAALLRTLLADARPARAAVDPAGPLRADG